MKRVFLLAALISFGTECFSQQTITVTVLSNAGATTTAPVNQLVTIAFDSSQSFYHAPLSLYTSMMGSGQASGVLPSGIPNGSHLTISTVDPCNIMQVSSVNYSTSTSNYNIGITLCASKRTGKVTLGNSTAPAVNAKVYHIRKYFDQMLNAYVLAAIDSTVTDGSGNYHMNYGPVITNASFFVKAALQPSDPAYNSYLPTYNTNALNWSAANALAYPDFNSDNIPLISGNNPGGPAFIGGSVLVGANKNTGVGDPLDKRILILTDANNTPVAYTYSAVNGTFSFPNIPYGTYKVFGDAMGKLNPMLTVTVSTTVPTVKNIVFEENSTKFEGHFNTTSIPQIPGVLAGIVFYPNPAKEMLYVKGLDAAAGPKKIMLMNAIGAVVFFEEYSAGMPVAIPMEAFPGGVYLLRVQTEAAGGTYRITK